MPLRDNWTETTLGDVAEASWGNTAVTKKQYTEFGFTAFSASGPDGYVDWFEHDEKGVVLSAIGALCGKTWLADGKWTPIKNTIWIKSISKNCLTDYLFLVSKMPDLWPIRGQAQPFISLGDVRLVEISLPPLDEQKRIVDLISSVDSYIDSLQSQVDAARTARNAVLHELLSTGGDDWTETTLGDIVVLEYGKPLKAEDRDGEGFPVFGSAGPVGSHSVPLVNDAPVIIVGRKGTAGAVWWSDEPCSVIDTAYYVVLRNSIDFKFLYLLLCHLDLPSLNAQTGVPGLNRDRAYSSEVILPPLAEQERIVEIISTMDDLIAASERAVHDAKNLRSGFLSDLLSGEHEIPASYDKLMGDS